MTVQQAVFRVFRERLPRFRFKSLKSLVGLFLVGAALSVSLAACSGGNQSNSPASSGNSAEGGKQNIELTFVGYAVPKAAHDAIIPKFQEQWKKDHNGQNVTFKQSYGGSGTQTRAILDGLEADVVHLAIGADVNKLVKAGFVQENWTQRVPNNGIVGETVAAIITREGNPKNIKTFADLARDDVKWVTPNPKTSGGARWNYYALWNYAKKTGGDDAKAKEFVTQAFQNVVVLAKDARESTDAFAKQGQGDALVNYENEVILAKQKGEKVDFVVPEVNISIDTPVTVIDKNVDKHGTREAAEAFVKFLFTPEAQREFAKVGFRPLGDLKQEPEIAKQFPPVKQLAKIDEYGGWKEAQKAFEDGGPFDAIEAAIGKK
ncbi:sulfate ABC transporter substrate-binding protein [Alkalinema sp. FACHB-956]|uniref:sulfate ABC transporter substrate-binding protein n=1 Tax=Alkalinema sp. FACHB-956 TaxID=2692768 RepID=UPI0016863F51|nr:sulfate ABC transporter substrate-binding protein [Alkalinema sp. FACHB-956]MBD2329993.1 sulfate ABC transporter substrate-binding protein [Alkalinema sp. FACHB-956]